MARRKHQKPKLTFEEVRDWCSRHWGLTLLNATNLQSDRTLKPYKRGFVLVGSFPGSGRGQRWYPSLRRVAQVTDFKSRLGGVR